MRLPAVPSNCRRPPYHRKETQTAVVGSCLLFIRSGQNHLAWHSERGRRQGRQRKRWADNIREWTGLEQAWSSPSPRGTWSLHEMCISCSNTSFPWLVFFFEAPESFREELQGRKTSPFCSPMMTCLHFDLWQLHHTQHETEPS